MWPFLKKKITKVESEVTEWDSTIECPFCEIRTINNKIEFKERDISIIESSDLKELNEIQKYVNKLIYKN